MVFSPDVAWLKQWPEQPAEYANWSAQLIRYFDDYRILSAIRHGKLGLHELNQQIELRVLNTLGVLKQGDWYVGRPVMMTYNDYQLGLSNGDIGICFKLTDDGKVSSLKFIFQVWINGWWQHGYLKVYETAYALDHT